MFRESKNQFIAPAALLALLILMANFALYSSNASTRAPASIAERSLVRAISLINSGKHKQAYSQLEKDFPRAKQQMDKARMALLLALSDTNYKLKRPRYFYAQFAEKNHLGLEEETRRRLIRIRADSNFRHKRITSAKQAYQELLSNGQISLAEKEYATYRLGWTYLNENKPGRAYRLWQNWLLQYSSGSLREHFLRDLGLAWSESLRTGGSSTIRISFGSDADSKLFLDGIVQEISRGGRKRSHLEKVNAALSPQALDKRLEQRLKKGRDSR